MIQDGWIGFFNEFSILYQVLEVYVGVCNCDFSMRQSTLPCSPGLKLKQELYHGLDALIKTGRSM